MGTIPVQAVLVCALETQAMSDSPAKERVPAVPLGPRLLPASVTLSDPSTTVVVVKLGAE
jgi:hypothetical protein